MNTKKRYEGRWTRFKEKQAIQDSTDHQVWYSTKTCVSVGTTPTEYPTKPFARKIPTSRRCRQRYARKREKEKSCMLQERIEVNIADLENQRRQIVWSVKEKVKESYGFLPDERRSAKQNALVILTTMEKWFYFCRPTNLAFHDLTIGKVAPRALQLLLGHQNPKSGPPPKSASQLSPRLQIILRSPSRGKSQQAGDADSGTPEKRKRTKAARSKSASRSTLETSKTDGAKSRGWSKKR